jgi:TonB-linked SusC/RagA family outer membrane protein
LSALIALSFGFQAFPALAQEQLVTIHVKDASLREVFNAIEEQATYRFSYRNVVIDSRHDITLSKTQATVSAVLAEALEGRDLEFSIVSPRSIVISDKRQTPGAEQAQGLSGVVKGEDGEPLAGASIRIKGSDKGTITDMDGLFTLPDVPADATLQISFIGYNTKEVKAAGARPLSVVLEEDTKTLDEVVVVGYGVQKKSDITGAVASLSSAMLEERPQTNIIQSLQGAVAGLNISITGSNAESSSSATTIRASNSITASNKPLIILDGIPFDGPWSEINSADVQSIEVLKDASSSAIYGARGANGVILITTKKGDASKLSISYHGFLTFSSPINLPRMMNGEEFWTYKLQALEEANTTTPTPDNPEPWVANMTDTEIRMHQEGRSTDWVDVITRDAFSQQHNISFRGGAAKTGYYISLNYIDAEGIALNDAFERYNIRFNMDQEFYPWLKFSTNTQMGRYNRSGNSPDFGRAFLMIPLAEPYNQDGTVKLKAWEHSSEAFNRNPLSNINEENMDIRYKVITNNVADISIPWISGLNYKLNTGFTFETSSYKNYQGRNTYSGEGSNGIVNTDDWNQTNWIVENIVSYIRQFGKHNVFFTGLYSAQSETYEQVTTSGKDFPNDVMYYYQLSKAGTMSASSSYWKRNHISQMARLNYGYDSRYLLTATVRRDGYSAFGKKTKFGVFPSMALGWNISNEDFYSQWKLSDWLSSLKLRLSYGKNGNEAVSGAYVTLPNLSTFNYLSEDDKPMFGFYPIKLESPSLGWETTTSLNAGIDFALWGGRLQGSFDMYRSTTKDLLLSKTIPTINGTDNLLENIGETASDGYEIQLTSNNLTGRDFRWTTTLNWVHYNSKIKHVGLFDADGNPIDDVASGWFIGHPVGSNYDYVFNGIWQITDPANPKSPQDPDYPNSIPGYMKYKEIDGKVGITTADREIIGRSIPDFTAGMMNTLSYKNVTLSFFVNSRFGLTARNALRDVNGNSYAQNKMMIEFWTPDNPINSYPKNQLNNGVNPEGAGFYEKADFVRLQDVTLAYKIPQRLLNRAGIDRLEVYANVKNLATWTTWSGLDPEFIGSQRAAPQVRQIILGVKFDF